MPVIFVGHGSPTIALEDHELTRNFEKVGQIIKEKYQPQAILSISAHWFRTKNRIQSAQWPQQIYDFRGFPAELSQIKYEPRGCKDLTNRLIDIYQDQVIVDDTWGIDHGTWTVLYHMFPDADIPVVQLSIDMLSDYDHMYEFAKKLRRLRDKYMVFGTGNIVHNLWKADWTNDSGSQATDRFDNYIEDIILSGNYEKIKDVESHQDYKYAVPQKDHFSPLVYALAASEADEAMVFNKSYQLGSISMTSYAFGV